MLHGTEVLKKGFAKMTKGGVIMDVVNAEQAAIAEEAGAVSVMALEKVPSDIRADGGVARMADPTKVQEIIDAVSIPVMAKGPINSNDKNPNAVLETTSVLLEVDVLDLNLPSGVTQRWFGDHARIKVKPVGKFYNPTTLDVEDNFVMWLFNQDYRGVWVHMSKTGYLGLFSFFGLTGPNPDTIPVEGVYIWGNRL